MASCAKPKPAADESTLDLTAIYNGCDTTAQILNSTDLSKPFVLSIGDMESIEMTKKVMKLGPSYNYIHSACNSGTTINGIEKVDSWLLNSPSKLIVFNFGIEDLRNPDITVTIYETNLRIIVTHIKASGIKSIFLNTTEFGDSNWPDLLVRAQAFRDAATQVMTDMSIPSYDLLSVDSDQRASFIDSMIRANL